MGNMIKSLFDAITGAFAWLNSGWRQRRVDAAEAKKAEDALEKRINATTLAISKGEADEVNKSLQQLRNGLKCLVILFAITLAGCCHSHGIYTCVYRDPGGGAHLCPRPECWETEAKMCNLAAAMTYIDMHPDQAARVSKQALYEYWHE
jgi:hypothetical protein